MKALLVSLAMDKFSYSTTGRFKFKDAQCRPLLGLLYICSAVESKGIECDILDQAVSSFSPEDLTNHIRDNEYIFVGFYSQLLISNKIVDYIKKIKERCPQTMVIIGGPGFFYYREFLDSGCDIICRGEAETTVMEIVDYLRGLKPIGEIDGIVYKKNNIIIYANDRKMIDDLDSIPFPSWDKVNLRSYYDFYILPMARPFVSMITSRGCPFRCAFCSSPYLWRNNYRVRSVNNVLEEIDSLIEEYGIRYIIFQDDVFGIDNDWLKEFCCSLIDRQYSVVHWMCVLHPLTFRQNPYQLIELMNRAGCNLFVFGLQTSNPQILKKINRDADEPRVLKDTIKIANKFGIMTSVDFICGLPQNTVESVREDVNFALEAKPHLVNFHPLRIEPGTELEKEYADRREYKFSAHELNKLCIKANRDFYLKIQSLVRIFKFILKTNPSLLFKITKFYTLFNKTLLK